MTEFSQLLRYKPGQEAGRQYMEDYIPVATFLANASQSFEGGKWWNQAKNFAP